MAFVTSLNFVTDQSNAVGAVADVLALTELMPLEYKHMLEGPTLKVDLHTGAIAEGVSTFLITIVVLIIIIKGPKSFFMKNWMLSVALMAVIIPGSSYTGPSMNPANNWMLSVALMAVIIPGSSYTGPSMNPANV
ncbi:major intrinsic protein, Aquaporin-like protein [Artemisia annua]|uniref:Major intrinsic protein, Aquaporin-like protein n=1 Tax=Artemisia annua TaxID=35608 RepID=A0A2U1KC62_ARTAN|nr:major intrinsic protein, Aquaporin-like protein [Artemisia annua]